MKLTSLAFALLLMGLFLMFTGMALAVASAVSGTGAPSFGGILLIGPFPIVMGSGPHGPLLALLAEVSALIMVVALAIMLLLSALSRPPPSGEAQGG